MLLTRLAFWYLPDPRFTGVWAVLAPNLFVVRTIYLDTPAIRDGFRS